MRKLSSESFTFLYPVRFLCPVSLKEQGKRWADFACFFSNSYFWGRGGNWYWSTVSDFQVPASEIFWILHSGANTTEDEGISWLPGCSIVQNPLPLDNDWTLIPVFSQIKRRLQQSSLLPEFCKLKTNTQKIKEM